MEKALAMQSITPTVDGNDIKACGVIQVTSSFFRYLLVFAFGYTENSSQVNIIVETYICKMLMKRGYNSISQ